MGKKSAVARQPKHAIVEHFPDDDAEAKRLIAKLGTYRWETLKITAQFSHNPYCLVALIDGQQHRVFLPGRRGTVLKWLLTKLDESESIARPTSRAIAARRAQLRF